MVKTKSIDQLQREIEELKRQIKRVEDEENQLNLLTPKQKLATWLHSTFCTLNHIDACAWEYEEIGDFGRPDKSRWIRLADEVIAKVGELY